MANTRVDVLADVEDVTDAELRGGRRHELHQPTRALRRDGARLEIRLDADDRLDKLGRERVPRGCRTDQIAVGRRALSDARRGRGRRRLGARRGFDVPDVEDAVTLLQADLGGG